MCTKKDICVAPDRNRKWTGSIWQLEAGFGDDMRLGGWPKAGLVFNKCLCICVCYFAFCPVRPRATRGGGLIPDYPQESHKHTHSHTHRRTKEVQTLLQIFPSATWVCVFPPPCARQSICYIWLIYLWFWPAAAIQGAKFCWCLSLIRSTSKHNTINQEK